MDLIRLNQINSLLIYPLIIESKIFGFMGFGESRYERIWEAEELDTLKIISGMIAKEYEKKFFEHSVDTSEINFNNLFESIDEMVIISTLDRDIIHCNEATIDKLGYSISELKGMSVMDLHPTDFRKKASDIVGELIMGERDYCPLELESKDAHEIGMFHDPIDIMLILNKLEEKGQMKNEEFVIKNKDGRLINGLFSIEPINNQGKKSWLLVMVDITKQVELTKSMEDKYRKLTNVIDGANLGTWEWNIETGELEVNERWAEMLGYSLDEIGDKREDTWRKFAHPEDLKGSDRLIEKHLNGETEFYDFEIRVKRKGGSWVWVHDKGRIIERDDSGRPSKIFGTHSDISLKKTKEL